MSEEHLAGPAQSSAGPWTGPQQVEGTAGLGKGWQNPRHSERGQLKSFLVLLWELFSHGFSWCGDCLEAQGINENL